MGRLLRDPTLRRLVRARDFIRAHPDRPLDLDAVAAEAGLSPFHLHRSFREAFGETPHAWHTRVRLDEARRLLLSTDLDVTDVCFEVGFKSLGSFSALFARHVGEPPSEWRRAMRPIVRVPELHAARIVPHCFWAFFGAGPAAQDPRSGGR